MASQTIEIVECDKTPCKREGAHTWTIMGPDGQWRVIDLCPGHHDKAIANLYLLARPLRAEPQARRGRPKKVAI